MCKVLLPKPSFGYTSTILVYHTLDNSYHSFAGNCRANKPYRTVSTHMPYAPEKMCIARGGGGGAHIVGCPICTINHKYSIVSGNNSAIDNMFACVRFY